jgi:hypothetical protein
MFAWRSLPRWSRIRERIWSESELRAGVMVYVKSKVGAEWCCQIGSSRWKTAVEIYTRLHADRPLRPPGWPQEWVQGQREVGNRVRKHGSPSGAVCSFDNLHGKKRKVMMDGSKMAA